MCIQALPLVRRANSGEATFYGVGLGSCGKKNTNSQMVAALSSSLMKNLKARCGKKVKVTNGKKSVVVTVVDSCPGCAKNDIDLSPAAFKKLASLGAGRIKIKWTDA
ncbi:hypothetical protein PHYBLDRAFT_105004 [Phycomyces blakesleeanus NRRL 1555(-)]|uniref:RlpA-like protein double-psi beta-barrel domain-containing protein n=2 Tax=Phycomyces blakesleeanus TaxID=4837 RepID=A0A167R371_PHYB8|nr:hypothetical protein PHYBLDRAFT_105004 [Phycomyces blakesleeanus NRRL 1555(-)]OAD80739.1 hypothetical protein PHYBLDRAFT_105004 [Phycomyces blakesleeanus NRRL 1555(-)]|eukprot:XP_018298779.1 hypothetical protein PHYBLDRAFT_105004 [Phycomyces blakesleeanus NRRL 1555(-)]